MAALACDRAWLVRPGAAALTLVVDGVDFTGAREDLLQTVAGDNSSHDLTITGNNFHNGHANIVSGGGVGSGAVLEAVVSGNIVAELGDFMLAAFYALVGGTGSDFARLGLDMTDNTFDASDADFGLNAVLLDQISPDAFFHFPGYAGSPDGELNGGTASTDIAAFLATQGNTLVDPPFAAYPGGVYAEFVFGVTGDLFTLPAWP